MLLLNYILLSADMGQVHLCDTSLRCSSFCVLHTDLEVKLLFSLLGCQFVALHLHLSFDITSCVDCIKRGTDCLWPNLRLGSLINFPLKRKTGTYRIGSFWDEASHIRNHQTLI